jgi:hypothetical protein
MRITQASLYTTVRSSRVFETVTAVQDDNNESEGLDDSVHNGTLVDTSYFKQDQISSKKNKKRPSGWWFDMLYKMVSLIA